MNPIHRKPAPPAGQNAAYRLAWVSRTEVQRALGVLHLKARDYSFHMSPSTAPGPIYGQPWLSLPPPLWLPA